MDREAQKALVEAALGKRFGVRPTLDASWATIRSIQIGWLADDVLSALRDAGWSPPPERPGEAHLAEHSRLSTSQIAEMPAEAQAFFEQQNRPWSMTLSDGSRLEYRPHTAEEQAELSRRQAASDDGT